MSSQTSQNFVRVTAAIMLKDGRLFIARRPDGDPLDGKWEFPGGKIKDGEKPEACLAREMKEEFDIEVSVGEFLGSSMFHYPHLSVELLAYRTTWISGSITMKAHDDYRWVSLKDLDGFNFAPADIPFVQMIRRGDIEL